MKSFLLISILLAVFCLAETAPSQTRRRSPNPAPKTPTPTATPTAQKGAVPTNTPVASSTLALVNGQAITFADLDPQMRQASEEFGRNMPSLRKDALDARINTLLVESEAQRRKMTKEQLLDVEVHSHIAEPTDAEVRALYDANKSQIGSADLESVRPQIVSYLKNQQVEKLSGDLVTRLRASHTVILGPADVNAPSLAPTAVLATVDGKAITMGDFSERLKPFIYRLQSELYQSEANSLDLKINQVLLEAEAKRLNKSPEDVYKAEVENKMKEPTDAEVTKFYEDNKTRIQSDLNSSRPDIVSLLKNQQQNRLEAEFAQRLRAGASIQTFLKEPEPLVQAINPDDDPSHGEANAPITVVEFTDFQCAACATMYPVIEEVLKSYGHRVRLVVRDFPLAMHANARKAAEAADAAAAQGKFFEYIAVLFKNQTALDVASLKKYASELGLDRAKFDAALDSGQYAAEVSHDVADGETYGVDATPTIFINGVRLRSLTAEGLRAAIESALSPKTH
jgi:protein-disulfide isomerase